MGLKGSGLRVLDLGCGTGRDCYVCAALVGEQGSVIGAWDATWQQQGRAPLPPAPHAPTISSHDTVLSCTQALT
jgi:SAM-dependent methyltransferase